MTDSPTSWPPRPDSQRYDPKGYRSAQFAGCVGGLLAITAFIAGAAYAFLSFLNGGSIFQSAIIQFGVMFVVVAPLAFWASHSLRVHKNNIYKAQQREREGLHASTLRSENAIAEVGQDIEELQLAMKEVEKNAIRTGDIIVSGDNSAVVVGSGSVQIIVGTKTTDPELARALQGILGLIEQEKNEKAGKLFDKFTHELNAPKPDKTMLEVLWNGIITAMPTVKAMTDIVSTIVKLFAP